MKRFTQRSRKVIANTINTGLAILAFGAPDLPLRGDSPSGVVDLTGEDVVGPFVVEALENNHGLIAADKRYLAAKESIVSAGALPNPKVQLTSFVESIQTRTGPQEQALMLQQPIPWVGKIDERRAVARSKSDALWHAYAAQQFDLVDQIANRVLEAAFLDKAIGITNENIGILERLESIVEGKVKAGGNLSDLLRLQLEIQSFEDLVAKQETMRTEAEARLQSLIGRRAGDASLSVAWDAPERVEADSQRWLQAIAERSPRIAMLVSLENSEVARERLASLASKPDFSVGINYIRTGDASNPEMPDSGRDPWAFMIGVSLPIWGKANNAIALQASLEKEAISAQIRDLEVKLFGEGRAWIAKLEDAEKRIQRYSTNLLPLARQSQEIIESGYRAGTNSILDLIDSDRQLLKLETEYWRAAADAWIARWKLATLSGGLWLN